MIRTAEPLTVEAYSEHRHTGGFLVVDEADGLTPGRRHGRRAAERLRRRARRRKAH